MTRQKQRKPKSHAPPWHESHHWEWPLSPPNNDNDEAAAAAEKQSSPSPTVLYHLVEPEDEDDDDAKPCWLDNIVLTNGQDHVVSKGKKMAVTSEEILHWALTGETPQLQSHLPPSNEPWQDCLWQQLQGREENTMKRSQNNPPPAAVAAAEELVNNPPEGPAAANPAAANQAAAGGMEGWLQWMQDNQLQRLHDRLEDEQVRRTELQRLERDTLGIMRGFLDQDGNGVNSRRREEETTILEGGENRDLEVIPIPLRVEEHASLAFRRICIAVFAVVMAFVCLMMQAAPSEVFLVTSSGGAASSGDVEYSSLEGDFEEASSHGSSSGRSSSGSGGGGGGGASHASLMEMATAMLEPPSDALLKELFVLKDYAEIPCSNYTLEDEEELMDGMEQTSATCQTSGGPSEGVIHIPTTKRLSERLQALQRFQHEQQHHHHHGDGMHNQGSAHGSASPMSSGVEVMPLSWSYLLYTLGSAFWSAFEHGCPSLAHGFLQVVRVVQELWVLMWHGLEKMMARIGGLYEALVHTEEGEDVWQASLGLSMHRGVNATWWFPCQDLPTMPKRERNGVFQGRFANDGATFTSSTSHPKSCFRGVHDDMFSLGQVQQVIDAGVDLIQSEADANHVDVRSDVAKGAIPPFVLETLKGLLYERYGLETSLSAGTSLETHEQCIRNGAVWKPVAYRYHAAVSPVRAHQHVGSKSRRLAALIDKKALEEWSKAILKKSTTSTSSFSFTTSPSFPPSSSAQWLKTDPCTLMADMEANSTYKLLTSIFLSQEGTDQDFVGGTSLYVGAEEWRRHNGYKKHEYHGGDGGSRRKRSHERLKDGLAVDASRGRVVVSTGGGENLRCKLPTRSGVRAALQIWWDFE